MVETWGDGVGARRTGVTSILTLGVGLLALFLGFEWFWMVFVLGWAVATPLVAILSRGPRSEDEDAWPGTDDAWPGTDDAWPGTDATRESTDHTSASGTKEDALETLRTRYASGELSDAEFERKLEQLLQTETLEDARRTVRSQPSRVLEDEREREPSKEPDR